MTAADDANDATRPASPRLIAGIPSHHKSLFHRVRFAAPDPAAWLEVPGCGSTFILRDIEVDRARRTARADRCLCPADVVDGDKLSGDRETATAQAVAALLRQTGAAEVVADRSLSLLTAEVLREAGITVVLDRELGVHERRSKDATELAELRKCQAATERAIARAADVILSATVDANGVLHGADGPITSERVRRQIDGWLAEDGLLGEGGSIVAGGTDAGDCHDRGHGPLRTASSIILDVFPRDPVGGYVGDCTRTLCHGDVPDWLRDAHATVLQAKAAAIAATRADVTGADVNAAAVAVIEQAGYRRGKADRPDNLTMPHGTGHGVGLEVHEAPLLDEKGPALLVGDVVTIEPGLYAPALGGVRLEDMVAVTAEGCENFNTLGASLKLI